MIYVRAGWIQRREVRLLVRGTLRGYKRVQDASEIVKLLRQDPEVWENFEDAGLTPYIVVRTIAPDIDGDVLKAMVILTMSIADALRIVSASDIKVVMMAALEGHETTVAASVQPYLSATPSPSAPQGRSATEAELCFAPLTDANELTMLFSAMQILEWFRPGTPVLPETAAALTRHCSSDIWYVHEKAILTIRNLVEDSPSNIELFVNAGVVAASVQLLKPGFRSNTQAGAIIVLAVAVRVTGGYKAARDTDAVRILLLLLRPCNNERIRATAASVLQYLFVCDASVHESCVMLKAVPHLVEMRSRRYMTHTRDSATRLLSDMSVYSVYADAITVQVDAANMALVDRFAQGGANASM